MHDTDGPGARGSRAAGRAGSLSAGLLRSLRVRRRAWTFTAAAVAFALIAAGTLAAGAGIGSAAAAGAGATPSPSHTAAPAAPVRPSPATAAPASKLRTCSVDAEAAAPQLGTLEADVLNATTGQVLFDRNGSTPAATGSVMKILTAAAALNVLGPNYRVPTTVVQGSTPGTIVLVGGGDVTLSRLPDGQASFYTGAPHIEDLADQVNAAWKANPANAGHPITNVIVDTSLFGGPVWQPSWDEQEERVIQGSTPYMTALMVDGDRADPTAVESPRSTTPIQRAAQYFVQYLGGDPTITYNGTAPAGAKQLGEVESQPVSTLIDQAMEYSDNTIMEELARLVAIKEGAGNTFAAENQGTISALASYGIPTTGLRIEDGSGLSADDAVPPSYVAQLMIKVLNRDGDLGIIYDGLPISGKTGTLGPGYDRFQGPASVAVGAVNAKTGWIDTAYTLAGVIHSKDGTPLAFAIYAEGNVSNDAKAAIDNLVAAMYECGNNLSNN